MAANCTKTFCVAKSWWGIRLKDSNGASNLLSIHWSSYFKGLYDQKQIPLAVMKIADNHLRLVFNHHQLKHDGRIIPYFDSEKKKKASELIQENSKVKKARVARDLQYIDAETKKQRDSSKRNVPEMSVREE